MKRREAIKILGTTAGGLFIAQFISNCKSPSGPSDPGKSYDTVEFMYQRVAPITNPGGGDPSCFMIRNNQIGGKNVHLEQTGDNEWRGETILDYNINSQNPYYIWVDGYKTNEQARDIFARVKGEQEWIKLTLIKPNGSIPGIDWAIFLIDKNGIYFPTE